MLLSPKIVDYLHRKELEDYRAFNSARYELRARVNGQPNGYKPVSEAELQDEKPDVDCLAKYLNRNYGVC